MVTKDHEAEPYELVQTLRDKLQTAKLSRNQIEKIIPPSLSRSHHPNLPPYKPGSYKKQCEEAKKRLEKLETQCLPRFVPKKVQDKYLNEFYELKAQGKLSHLSPEMLEKLEEEIKTSAADIKKHAELEEFIASLKQTTIPEHQSMDTHDGVSTEPKNSISQGYHSINNRENAPIINVRTHDGHLVPCFVMLSPASLCLNPLSTEKKEPKEKKGPVKVSVRTVPEVLDALNIVNEYVQQYDLIKYIEGLKALEKTIRKGV